jgi:hypothetical protein
MRPALYDLFGEVPVTRADVALWLECVPHIDPCSPRAEWYVKGWDVPSKIRQAKLSGRFDKLKRPPDANAIRWAFV